MGGGARADLPNGIFFLGGVVFCSRGVDAAQGAEVTVGVEEPTIRTAPTRAGLTYKFFEGEALDGLFDGGAAATKVGDGAPWITVKGGRSGFYSIRVEK